MESSQELIGSGISPEAEAALNWSATRREFRPIVTAEEAKSFYFTSDRIIELASESESQKPEFRDHFKLLAHKLREDRPPGLLRLLDIGEEKRRLFRVWERREFASACVSSLGDSARTRKLLSTLLDGLLYLDEVFPVQTLHVSAYSLDSEGIFIARLPFTAKVSSETVFPGDLGRREMTFLDINAAMPHREASRADIFLSYLGNFVCHQLTGQWLYSKPPMTKLGTGVMSERSSLNLETEMLRILYRMAPESQTGRFPVVVEALHELQSCLRGCA